MRSSKKSILTLFNTILIPDVKSYWATHFYSVLKCIHFHLMRCGKSLDIDYIIKQLTPLCELKESPEIVEKLKSIIAENI